MIVWALVHPRATYAMLGYLPQFLDERDPRPAKEQFDENYCSGWSPFQGHTMLKNGMLAYPDDPPLHRIAEAKLRDELIVLYECEWVAIIQPDGSFEVARMD